MVKILDDILVAGGRAGDDILTAGARVDPRAVDNAGRVVSLRNVNPKSGTAIPGRTTASFDTNVAQVANGSKKLTILIKGDGKFMKGTFTLDELARYFNKSLDDVTRLADDVDVKNASTTRRSDLLKLGFAGSMVTAVIFLMLVTGEPNPIEAIQKAIEAAAEVAKDAGKDLFSGLFGFLKTFSGFSAVCVFIVCLVLIVFSLSSAVLKK